MVFSRRRHLASALVQQTLNSSLSAARASRTFDLHPTYSQISK
jgi:hypothetical protein